MSRITRHVLLATAIGFVVGVTLWILDWKIIAGSLGWDAAAITFLVLTWIHIWPMGHEETIASVESEAPSRFVTDVVVVLAALLSLVTVVLLLFHNMTQTLPSGIRTLVGVSTVGFAWGVVHTVFSLRYAREYYTDPVGGIDFHTSEPPAYVDFAYLAFGVGMAFQVADTDLSTRNLRRTVLQHALLSYVFTTTVLAVTINLIATLNG